jgi:hypothetical protein
MTTAVNVRALPVGAIVATDDRVWIKRETDDDPRSPFYETWWIEASTFAIQVPDREIHMLLNDGEAQVLRPTECA